MWYTFPGISIDGFLYIINRLITKWNPLFCTNTYNNDFSPRDILLRGAKGKLDIT